MSEVVQAYAFMITTFANFLFTIKFSDGVNLGGFLLACSIMAVLIRFLFKQIQAAPVTFKTDLSARSNLAKSKSDADYRSSYEYYRDNRSRMESYNSLYNSEFGINKKGR